MKRLFKYSKNILALLLLSATVIALFACGSSGDSQGIQDNSENGSQAEERPLFWGGKEVIILCGIFGEDGYYNYSTCILDGEDDSDNPIKQAIYDRRIELSRVYGIKVKPIYDNTQNIGQRIREDIQSGVCNYDAILGAAAYIAPLAGDGLLKDLSANQYIKLDKPWWDEDFTKNTKINGKNYFITCDSLLSDNTALRTVFFNKDIITEHDLDNPYDLVKNGAWTFDKMYEMAKAVEYTSGEYKQYHGDVDDVWGWLCQSYDMMIIMNGFGQTTVDNSGELPVLRIDADENVKAFEKLAVPMMKDTINIGLLDYNQAWDTSQYDHQLGIFADGRALFMTDNISKIYEKMLIESEVNYGLLPLPKYDESQENYYSYRNPYQSYVFAIPVFNFDKTDVTCAAVSALAEVGEKEIVPLYKASLSENSGVDNEMLDLILGNPIYDMGYICNYHNDESELKENGGTLHFYSLLFGSQRTDILNFYDKVKEDFQKGIEAFCE